MIYHLSCIYNLYVISWNFMIYLLTAKAILMIAFVTNYDIMSGKKRE